MRAARIEVTTTAIRHRVPAVASNIPGYSVTSTQDSCRTPSLADAAYPMVMATMWISIRWKDAKPTQSMPAGQHVLPPDPLQPRDSGHQQHLDQQQVGRARMPVARPIPVHQPDVPCRLSIPPLSDPEREDQSSADDADRADRIADPLPASPVAVTDSAVVRSRLPGSSSTMDVPAALKITVDFLFDAIVAANLRPISESGAGTVTFTEKAQGFRGATSHARR